MKKLVNGFHKLNSLQYLRALCAIAVVLYHAEGDANKDWQSTAKASLFAWGHVGVPMFFCLSGFVIAYSGYLRPKKPFEFFYTRLARIYPAYLATAFIFIACLIVLPAGIFNSAPSVSFEKLARTILFDFGRPGGYVYVGWTLFYEMIFYICFSFLILRFPAVARSKLFYYSIATSLVICYSFAATRIADFLIGISVFLIALRPLDKGYASIPCYVLFGALGLGVFSHPVGILCGVTILCFLKVEDLLPSAFRFKPLLIMGDSSYSIYLIQVLTVSASTKLAKWFVLATPLFASNYLFFYILSIAIAIVSTTAVGILMRRYLEKPSYKYLVNLRDKIKISL